MVTPTPLLPVITIEGDSSTYTYNPFTSTFDFYLHRGQFAPPYLNTAGYFDLKISDPNNVIFDDLSKGAEVTIWVGKDDSSKVKVFLGVLVQDGVETEDITDGYLRLSGPDWGSYILQNRILNNYLKQQPNSDGTPDDTDTSTEITTLVYDILTNSRWYPNQGLTIEGQGVTVNSSNIQIASGLSVAEFGASMQYAEDVLRTLDGIAYGAYHYIDPNKTFYMKIPDSIDTGILLVDDYSDSVAATWDTTKLGFVSGPTSFQRSAEEYRKVIWAVGASRPDRDTDLFQSTDSSSQSVYNKSWATKIDTLNNIRPQYIGVKIERVGTPVTNLIFELREDITNATYPNGSPTGTVIRRLELDKASLAASTTDWRFFDLNGEELNSKQSYWIILYANGADASNTFKWHNDNGSSGTNAYSTDNGATWTVQTSSYKFCIDYWFVNELRDSQPNDANVIGGDNFFSEELIREPNFKDDAALSQLIDATAARAFYEKYIFKSLVYAPDTLLQNGQKVRIRVQQNPVKNFDYNDFVISGIEYVFDDSAENQDGMLYYDLTAVRIAK